MLYSFRVLGHPLPQWRPLVVVFIRDALRNQPFEVHPCSVFAAERCGELGHQRRFERVVNSAGGSGDGFCYGTVLPAPHTPCSLFPVPITHYPLPTGLVWCFHCACTVLVWCWYGAGTLFNMRGLVLFEVDHLDTALPAGRVALDEAATRQLVQEGIDITVVVGQDLGLDALRPVLKPALTVRPAPETLKEQSAERADFSQRLVAEEARLEDAHSCHSVHP